MVGTTYLKDFDLDSTTAYMAASEDDMQHIVHDNPCLEDAEFLVPRAGRPKLFVMGCVLLAPSGYVADGQSTVALQISPNYTGCPYYPHDEKVTYKKKNGDDELELLAGGGLVETFAFGGEEPNRRSQSGGDKAKVGRPAAPMSLARAAGISSAAMASGVQYFDDIPLDLKAEVWPITSSTFPKHQKARTYNVGDGGTQDNAGLLALLQRQADKIVWIANSYRGLNQNYDYENATPETFDPEAAGVVDQLYDKFGYGYETGIVFYSNNTVFPKGELLPSVKQLVALKKAGKPAIVPVSLRVLPNSFWGIKGWQTVEILLVYLDTVTEFEQSLPADTQAELAREGSGLFPKFSTYQTGVSLSACQVNLLAAQSEYSVMQNETLFRKFLAPKQSSTRQALGGA